MLVLLQQIRELQCIYRATANIEANLLGWHLRAVGSCALSSRHSFIG